MKRVYSLGCQIPGVHLFKCPICDFLFNVVFETEDLEGELACPKCKEKFAVVFAVDPHEDPDLHSELEISPSVDGSSSQSQFFECPYCHASSITVDTHATMGGELEKRYLYTCFSCNRTFMREIKS